MSQEKVDAYKNYKADRKSNANKSKKEETKKKIRTVVFYAVFVCIVGGIAWSVVNLIGSYKESVPNYDATDVVIYDYAQATTEIADTVESLVDEGAISVEDGGEVVVNTDAVEEETTAQ